MIGYEGRIKKGTQVFVLNIWLDGMVLISLIQEQERKTHSWGESRTGGLVWVMLVQLEVPRGYLTQDVK